MSFDNKIEDALRKVRPDLDLEELERKKYFPEKRRAIRIKRSALLQLRSTKQIEIKIADNKEELEMAYRILHDAYVDSGYMNPHPSGIRVSIFNALIHTITFIIMEEREIVGSISLTVDSPLSLPMDEIYKEELESLRREERKLAETTSLAVKRDCRNQNIPMYLYKAMFGYAQFAGLDDICITVNPKHVQFYQEILLFQPIGGLKVYSKVMGAPAVAMRIDLRRAEEKMKEIYSTMDFDADLYTFFFTNTMDKQTGTVMPGMHYVMTPQLLRYFFVEKTDVFKTAPSYTISTIKTLYPFYDFRKIMGNCNSDK